MKRLFLAFLLGFAISPVWSRQAGTPPPLNIRESDGSPSNYPYQFKVPNGSLTDNADGTMTLTITTSAISSSAILLQSTLQSGATFFVSSGTAVQLNVTTLTATGIVGTITNDNANTGNYGEYVSSANATNVSAATSGQYDNNVSITLTAGDWDITGTIYYDQNASTWSQVGLGIGTVTGNDSTGLVSGNTALYYATINLGFISIPIPAVRVSISSPTTYYLKRYFVYSGGTPRSSGMRISARRPR